MTNDEINTNGAPFIRAAVIPSTSFPLLSRLAHRYPPGFSVRLVFMAISKKGDARQSARLPIGNFDLSLAYSRGWCSLVLAPLTTSFRPRNSLSCNSATARFASSTVCICTKANPFERWLCL